MERDKALDMALSQIEKQFGKGSVMRMGENLNMGIESIPTGAMALDMALGVGGLPRGRIVEIYGPESSGKSTLAMHVVAEAQRNGGICAYIDAEHAMDPVYAGAIGVNVDDLLISQPDTGEQALEIADMLIRSGALDVLVIDSVAALTPRAEIEGEMGDSHVGLQARLMSQALRKLTGTLSKTNTIAIFINQLREKIGVMYGCFSGEARVVLADGTTEKIGKIVNQRLPRFEGGSGRPQAGGELVRQRKGRPLPPDHGGQADGQRKGQFGVYAQPPHPYPCRLERSQGPEGRRPRAPGPPALSVEFPVGGTTRHAHG
jgi:recombination protein RecA